MRITLVTPTYQRRERIKRALAYWSHYPVRVIVVDGSPAPTLTEAEIKGCANVSYFHLPVSLEERLLAGVSLIDTPYAMLLPDDEFVVYPALVEASDRLDADPDLSGVLGQTIGFMRVDGKMVAGPTYSSARDLRIDSESPVERLDQRLAVPDNSIFYSLTRTQTLQLAARFMAEREYSCKYITEYQMEAVLCATGKVKVLPRIFWLRSFETERVSHAAWDRSLLFRDWCRDVKNAVNLAHLIESSDRFLSLAGSGEGRIPGSAFVEKFSRSEAKTTPPVTSVGQDRYRRARRWLLDRLPKNVRTGLVRFRRTAFMEPPGTLRELPHVFARLDRDGIRYDIDELLRIKRLVEEDQPLARPHL